MANRKRLGAMLLLTLASFACGTTQGDKVFDRGAPVVPPQPLVRLARTGACLGRCPVYTVEVDVDGGVTYLGSANVKTEGPATGRLAPDALRQLREAMGKASRAKIPTEKCACNCATDAAVVKLTTWDKGASKTVAHEEGCERTPHALRVLEDEVDYQVEIERWIGTIQQRRLCFKEQRDCSAFVRAPAPR